MKPYGVLVATGTLGGGATLILDDAEQHHLRVRRAAPGAALICYDGAGATARGVLRSSDTVELEDVAIAPPPPATVLAVGAGDKDRFIALAERCTELGVTRLIPIATERSLAVSSRMHDAATMRARSRAREACKQCGNAWATTVDALVSLDSLAAEDAGVCWLLADGTGSRCPPLGASDAVGWIIGPEGGLTEPELVFCRDRLAAVPVVLGSTVLRFDTAAIAAAVITDDRRCAGGEHD